jgi:hypothetical protein
MVKRTTISVPDELHKRMEQWKEEINFSKEFQRCIGKLIDKKESYKTRVKEAATMEQIVERLKKEKEKSFTDWEETGQREGLDWAKRASYDALQFVLSWDGSYWPSKDTFEGQSLVEYFEDRFDVYKGLKAVDDFYEATGIHYATPVWLSDSGEIFIEAWREAVSDFWDEVEDKL